MIVYLAVLLVVPLLAEVYKASARKSPYAELSEGEAGRKGYIILVSTLLALQSGLRHWAVGADTYAYYEYHFEPSKYRSWSSIFSDLSAYYWEGVGKDPGYSVFSKLTQCVFPHYQLFLICIAVLFFSALAYFIYSNTKTISNAAVAYVLYCALFFSFFSITGHRQTIATAAALYAYKYIKARKLLRFLVLILVASTIHKSVLIFIPFYFAAPVRGTKWIYLALVVLFPVLMVYRNSIISFLGYFGGYSTYGEQEGAGTYTFSLMLLVFSAVAVWRMPAVLRDDPKARFAYNALAIAVSLTPLTWVNQSAMRVVQYFSLFLLLLAPKVVDSFRSDSAHTRQMAYWCCLGALIALSIRAHWGFEYAFFWQHMELPDNYY